MSKVHQYRYALLRSSEAPDGTVTGEEEIRVLVEYRPAEPMTRDYPGCPDIVEVACAEVEDFSTSPPTWREAPKPRFPGDFDYVAFAEDHDDELLEFARDQYAVGRLTLADIEDKARRLRAVAS